jgi:copper transport protein
MSVWIGGLVALLFVVPAGHARLEPPERTPPAGGPAAALLAARARVRRRPRRDRRAPGADRHGWSLSALTDTPFGRSVLIKVALLVVLVGLGAVNRQRVVPGLRRLADGGEPPGAAGPLAAGARCAARSRWSSSCWG